MRKRKSTKKKRLPYSQEWCIRRNCCYIFRIQKSSPSDWWGLRFSRKMDRRIVLQTPSSHRTTADSRNQRFWNVWGSSFSILACRQSFYHSAWRSTAWETCGRERCLKLFRWILFRAFSLWYSHRVDNCEPILFNHNLDNNNNNNIVISTNE